MGVGSVGERLKRPASIKARAGHTYPGVSGERTASGSACAIHAAHATRATAPVTMIVIAQRATVRRSASTTRSTPPATLWVVAAALPVRKRPAVSAPTAPAIAERDSCPLRRHAEHRCAERQANPADQ
jgi:hypothetical protein